MSSASALRYQIEAALADRIPAALSPAAKTIREVVPTGVAAVDSVLEGGLPVGAVTEMVGSECSGRTALALSFLAQITQAERVCAWIDVSNALCPESAAAAGVDLRRLLWVCCGTQPGASESVKPPQTFTLPEQYLTPPVAIKGLHGGGGGPHPRAEVKSLPHGISALLGAATPSPPSLEPRCAEPQPRLRAEPQTMAPFRVQSSGKDGNLASRTRKPWSRIEQALRSADLLLQGGGFSAMVLDFGSIAAEDVSRIPLATWFRYAAAAERSRTSVLLLTQHACSKSSAGLVLRLHATALADAGSTVLTGVGRHVEVSRQRFVETSPKVVPLRKPAQRVSSADWQAKTTWAGFR